MGRKLPSAAVAPFGYRSRPWFFSLPIARYDGERLFSCCFPLVDGCGYGSIISRENRFSSDSSIHGHRDACRPSRVQFVGLVTLHPFQLSYYNALMGGLPGADRLGFEATYCGETPSVTKS